LSVRMFGLGGKKARKRVLELRRPVTVPRDLLAWSDERRQRW
jgi:hypothetical protein